MVVSVCEFKVVCRIRNLSEGGSAYLEVIRKVIFAATRRATEKRLAAPRAGFGAGRRFGVGRRCVGVIVRILLRSWLVFGRLGRHRCARFECGSSAR